MNANPSPSRHNLTGHILGIIRSDHMEYIIWPFNIHLEINLLISSFKNLYDTLNSCCHFSLIIAYKTTNSYI